MQNLFACQPKGAKSLSIPAKCGKFIVFKSKNLQYCLCQQKSCYFFLFTSWKMQNFCLWKEKDAISFIAFTSKKFAILFRFTSWKMPNDFLCQEKGAKLFSVKQQKDAKLLSLPLENAKSLSLPAESCKITSGTRHNSSYPFYEL